MAETYYSLHKKKHRAEVPIMKKPSKKDIIKRKQTKIPKEQT